MHNCRNGGCNGAYNLAGGAYLSRQADIRPLPPPLLKKSILKNLHTKPIAVKMICSELTVAIENFLTFVSLTDRVLEQQSYYFL